MRRAGFTVLSAIAAGVLLAAFPMTAYAGQWESDGQVWKYRQDDGNFLADCWQWLDGDNNGTAECYRFDGAGNLYVSTVVDGCTVDAAGAWTEEGQVRTKKSGELAAANAAFNASVPVGEGWYQAGDTWRYGVGGKALAGTWKDIGGKRYYFDGAGNMVTGFQNVNGSQYYFGTDGGLTKDTFLLDGIYYVIPEQDGVIQDEVEEFNWDDYRRENDYVGSYGGSYGEFMSYGGVGDYGDYPGGRYDGGASSGEAAKLTEREAGEAILAMKDGFPEGMSWTNDDAYKNGYGCAAFAFLVQDEVFGDARSQNYYDFNWERIKVGDHIRLPEHSVIILTKDDDGVTVAEGNYNFSIHWGRRISRNKLEQQFVYQETRY